MKLSRLAAIGAASALALAVPASAGHSWSNYHWKRAPGAQVAPFVALNLSGQWPSYSARVISDWNRSDHIESLSGQGSSNPKTCKAVSGTIQVCNARYGQTGWLGIAQVWLSGGHIVQGITKLNDTYFDTSRYNTPAWRRMVFCQEVGHDYGLGHVNENFNDPNTGSCMDYSNDPSRNDGAGTNEYPNDHDYQQLTTIYGGHDESTGGSFAIRSVGQPAAQRAYDGAIGGDTPGEWGRAIHRDGLGRPDVFAQDLPGGGRKITHVFWTLEHRGGGHEH